LTLPLDPCDILVSKYAFERSLYRYDEGMMRARDRAGSALFSGHVIEVWVWQIYLYAIATTLGVTMNAAVLMYMVGLDTTLQITSLCSRQNTVQLTM
jgi:hypothetical protein